MNQLLSVAVVAVLGTVGCGAAAADTVRLMTLEWPPYTGSEQSLAEGGFLTSILRQAFAKRELHLEVRVLPWVRAVQTAMAEVGGARGFYSASPSECSDAQGRLSAHSIGWYQFGLAERSDAPIRWTTADDLKDKIIGTVTGYDNGAFLDRLIREGRVRTVGAVSDDINLRRLDVGRTDLASVEVRVFRYLKPKLALDRLVLNPQPTTDRLPLFVCFARSPAADAARLLLNELLPSLDVDAITQHWLLREGS